MSGSRIQGDRHHHLSRSHVTSPDDEDGTCSPLQLGQRWPGPKTGPEEVLAAPWVGRRPRCAVRSQNVSEPKVAGSGTGAAPAQAVSAPVVSQEGTGGHGTPLPELSVGWAGQAAETANTGNVSGPKSTKVAGSGIDAAPAQAAAAPTTPQEGTGGPVNPASEQQPVAGQAAETANTVSPEEILLVSRLGMNRRDVCKDSE